MGEHRRPLTSLRRSAVARVSQSPASGRCFSAQSPLLASPRETRTCRRCSTRILRAHTRRRRPSPPNPCSWPPPREAHPRRHFSDEPKAARRLEPKSQRAPQALFYGVRLSDADLLQAAGQVLLRLVRIRRIPIATVTLLLQQSSRKRRPAPPYHSRCPGSEPLTINDPYEIPPARETVRALHAGNEATLGRTVAAIRNA